MIAKHPTDTRDDDALRRHYQIECELADRLRAATPDSRRGLYSSVYNELFVRVPDHPQNTRKLDASQQEAMTRRQLRLLDGFLTPQTTYLEIGAGDCHLAMEAAGRCRHVYAVDVSDVIAAGTQRPANFGLVLSDGVSIDVPPGTVDVAYSNQLMEHLHPDDAEAQLRQIVRAMAPGGRYICVTPHRFSGPHDISCLFDREARGFHMKEYTYGELRRLFLRAGFAEIGVLAGLRGRHYRMPRLIVSMLEGGLRVLPHGLRRWLSRSLLLRRLFECIHIVGYKAT